MAKRSDFERGRNLAVGYVRRSTDRQEHSIPDQKKALESYVVEHGLRLVKYYVDDAISGTSTLRRRAFQQMMQDAQKPSRPFGCVVVYDIKRFGRIDNDEAGYYRHLLRTHGVEVRYVSENFNGDSTDDLLRPVKQWQARQESKDLSKVTIRGLLSKMEYQGGGWWMGGTPPLGYDLKYESADRKFLFIVRSMSDGSKQIINSKGKLLRTLIRGESLNISKRDQAKLVPSSPERVRIIEQIFDMYTKEGKGFRAIADTLNRKKIPTPRGPQWSYIYSGQWTVTTIRAILVNPIYVGDMVWNRRTDGRFHKIRNRQAVERENIHGSRLVPNDETEWMVVRNAHAPLISRRMFKQARERREGKAASEQQRGQSKTRNMHGKTWTGQRSRFILSGLMRCGQCGHRYQGVTRQKGKKRKDGTRAKNFYYGCGGHITKGNAVCRMNPVPKKELESFVIDAVLDHYRPLMKNGGRQKLGALVKNQIQSESKDVGTAKQRTEKKLQQLNQTIDNLLDNITPTNRKLVDKRLGDLTQKRKELELNLEELDSLDLSRAEIVSIVSETMQFLASLELTLHEGLPQEKLVALRQCIQSIDIKKSAGQIRIILRTIPAANLQNTQEFTFKFGFKSSRSPTP